MSPPSHLFFACAGLALLALGSSGVALLLPRPLAPATRPAGPYRSPAPSAVRPEPSSAHRLSAFGSILLSAGAMPALVGALVSLRWEGIGVTLLAAVVLAFARLQSAIAVLREEGVGGARVLARASLLFDLPVAVFAIVHIRFVEDGLHDSWSLAAVAGAFAVIDGVQAAMVLRLLQAPASR
ncbi:MAG TPA: hypothetical protein VLM85_32815 [Polyangiaceae bacterium]|nr:hypothetical protein [Polyangiaceae bacterium]